MGIEGERRSLCRVENLQSFTQHLNASRRHVGVHGFSAPRTHTSRYLQYVLAANAVCALEVLLGIRVKNDLNYALTITHIEKNHATVVSAAIHPATQRDRLIDQTVIDQAAVVASHRCFHGVLSRPQLALEDSLFDEPEGLVSAFLVLSAFAAEPLESALDLPAPSLRSPAIFFLSPVLKSVSYQPPPDRRKDGALTRFFSAGLSQAGQSVSGASASF